MPGEVKGVKNPRLHGDYPFKVVLVHGGPGAPGELQPLGMEIAAKMGVIESFQTGWTIASLIDELQENIALYSNQPVISIGHSWGAWLSLLHAAKYPASIKKIILIGAAPFHQKSHEVIRVNRMGRLDLDEQEELLTLRAALDSYPNEQTEKLFKRYVEIINKADQYEPILLENPVLEIQFAMNKTIWKEASSWRDSGKLLHEIEQISCPVVAIHGDYDPHPYTSIEEVLSQLFSNFHFYLIAQCGHVPWNEKQARETFFEVLFKEIYA